MFVRLGKTNANRETCDCVQLSRKRLTRHSDRASRKRRILLASCAVIAGLVLCFFSLCERNGSLESVGSITHRNTSHRTNLTIACWILRTNSRDDLLRSQAIKDSWGTYCNTIDFIDKETPGIVADWVEVYKDISAKSYRAWNFMYWKYLNPGSPRVPIIDFVLKADIDTYMIGANMHEYLVRFDPDKPHYIGKNFIDFKGNHFVAGTAIILSRAALRILAHTSSYNCSFEKFRETHQAEDLALAICLRQLGIRPHDTRDSSGAERFMVFSPDVMRVGDEYGQLPSWYYNFSQNKLVGKGCCSESAIAFHYTTTEQLQTQTLVLRDAEWFWTKRYRLKNYFVCTRAPFLI